MAEADDCLRVMAEANDSLYWPTDPIYKEMITTNISTNDLRL